MSRAPTIEARLAALELICFDVDGVLTDGLITYADDGRELKSFNVQDGAAIKLLLSHGIEVALLTGRESPMVTRRAAELGIAHLYQGLSNKVDALEQVLAGTGIDAAAAAHVGDDLPDLPLFERVGIAICVPNAHPAVIERADLVTVAGGGAGVARELAQRVLEARGDWPYPSGANSGRRRA